ncbi:MAG TPA: DUF1819 family protein [Clostridiaceae bacterium]|nr:DUF1819 family protein [Clostridiaceae bacterium]
MTSKFKKTPHLYSSGMVAESFWFLEFKAFLKLKNNGLLTNEIRDEVIAANLFGAPNETRAKRMFQYIKKRADVMDGAGRTLFFDSDIRTQKLMVLVCIMYTNRLFFEFMNEVYREKIILGYRFLERSDATIFFRNKEVQSEKVAAWQDRTKIKLFQVYAKILEDAGLLGSAAENRPIIPPLLDQRLRDYLKINGGQPYVAALTGGM